MKRKKTYKIISIMLLIIILFPYTTTLAATVEEVGNAIATFATNYYNKAQNGGVPYIYHPGNAGYPSGWMSKRAISDFGFPIKNPYSSYAKFDHYALDCVGWVNFCIYNATGIKYQAVTNGSGGYVSPQRGVCDKVHFEVVNGPAQPGDILKSSSHVLICSASGEGIESNSSRWTKGNTKGPFKTSSIGSYTVIRIKDSAAATIDASTLTIDPSIASGSSASTSIFENEDKESKFYYNGIPDGKYSVTSVNILDWIINTIKEVFSFIVNLLTYIVRMVFVGWTFLIENMMTDIIKKISGEDNILNIDATNYGENGNKYTDDNITIERIIFDEVKVFDVDFFSTESK